MAKVAVVPGSLVDEEPKKKMTCMDLHEAMKRPFPVEGFMHMMEVRNATGFDANRSADHMCLGMYQSRGRELWGFEMKVTRSDWVKELEQPAKAESWMRFCDRWALVIADESMVHVGELPETWGMYAMVKGKLKCIKPCPKLEPLALTRVALTALMYAAAKTDEVNTNRLIREAVDAALKSERSMQGWRLQQAEKLQENVKAFEDASGLHITYGTPEKVTGLGKVVHAVSSGKAQLERRMGSVEYAIKTVEDMLPALREQLEVLRTASTAALADLDEETL